MALFSNSKITEAVFDRLQRFAGEVGFELPDRHPVNLKAPNRVASRDRGGQIRTLSRRVHLIRIHYDLCIIVVDGSVDEFGTP